MKKRVFRRKPLLIIGAVVSTVLIAGGIVVARQHKATPKTESLITYSTDSPDESKANADNYDWRGTPDEPKKIRITKINVDAFVQKAGVDQRKQVAVPNNVHLAGWFAESAKPGQDGLSIIAGHVSGKTSDGVFKNLNKLSKGDEFEIELGNGEVKHHKLVDTQQVKESAAADVLFSQQPSVKSQVNLITCGGQFDRGSNQFSDRIIVAGELQAS